MTIFGDNASPTGTAAIGDSFVMCQVSCPQTGTLTTLYVWFYEIGIPTGNLSEKFKGILYTDNGSNQPGSELYYTPTQTVTILKNALQWVQFTITGLSWSVTAGTKYWLGVVTTTGLYFIPGYDVNTAGLEYDETQGGWPPTEPTWNQGSAINTQNHPLCEYLTYATLYTPQFRGDGLSWIINALKPRKVSFHPRTLNVPLKPRSLNVPFKPRRF